MHLETAIIASLNPDDHRADDALENFSHAYLAFEKHRQALLSSEPQGKEPEPEEKAGSSAGGSFAARFRQVNPHAPGFGVECIECGTIWAGPERESVLDRAKAQDRCAAKAVPCDRHHAEFRCQLQKGHSFGCIGFTEKPSTQGEQFSGPLVATDKGPRPARELGPETPDGRPPIKLAFGPLVDVATGQVLKTGAELEAELYRRPMPSAAAVAERFLAAGFSPSEAELAAELVRELVGGAS